MPGRRAAFGGVVIRKRATTTQPVEAQPVETQSATTLSATTLSATAQSATAQWGWLAGNAGVREVKRRVYLLGLPFGAVSAVLLFWLEWEQGTLHSVDRVGLPLLAGLVAVLELLFWRRRGSFFVLELLLFSGLAAMILASLGYSVLVLPSNDVNNLRGLGYWTSVLSTLAFLIFGVRTGLKISLTTFFAAVGIWLAEITLGDNGTIAERTILFQLYSANAIQLLLLWAFGVLVHTQTQQATRLERDANTDILTGLPNRRFLQAQLGGEFERAERYGRTFSVALLDLDHFKRVNDTFGHAVGDKVLQEVARLLTGQARNLDTTGRWGGEEFLLLLPELPLGTAFEVAERFRQLVAEHPFSHGHPLTVSLGVAEYRADEGLDGLLNRADTALYDAKTQGRNRVWPGQGQVDTGLETAHSPS